MNAIGDRAPLLACLFGAALSIALVGCAKPKGDDTTASESDSDTADTADTAETVDVADVAAEIEEACAELFTCGCIIYPYEDEAACVADEEGRLAAINMLAANKDLTVDAACFVAQLSTNKYGCDPLPGLAEWVSGEEGIGECPNCQVAYGTKGIGETCTFFGLDDTSDCAQGLRCGETILSSEPACYDPCAPPTVDAPCPAAGCGDTMVCGRHRVCIPKIGRDGDECAYGDVTCGPGLSCDDSADEDGTCFPGLAPGESCDGCWWCCAGDYYCGPSSTCDPLPAVGEACTPSGECAAGIHCSGGTCAPIPAIGEPCEDQCPDWMPCPQATKICAPPPGFGEPCVEGACAGGLDCGAADLCTAPPAVCWM